MPATYIAASTLDSWNIYALIQSKSGENQPLRKNTWLKGPICLSIFYRWRSMPIRNLKTWIIETPFPCRSAIDQIRWLHGPFTTSLTPEPWPSTAESTRLMQGKHLPQWVGLNVPLKAFRSDASPQTIVTGGKELLTDKWVRPHLTWSEWMCLTLAYCTWSPLCLV